MGPGERGLMTIQHIGSRAMSLYITESELMELDLKPEEIGLEEAKWLLARALEDGRLSGWEAAELTIYPGVDSVLLFARRRSGLPFHFFFSDFETLVALSHLCPDTLPSSLSRVRGGYVLTLYPFEGETPPAVVYEFSQEIGTAPYLVPHMKEQNALLLPVSALAYLRTHFPLGVE